MTDRSALWPELAYASWRDTAVTLQLWFQIVGKVRLGLTPWQNHSWHVPFYVTARGLATSPIPVGHEIVEIEFDFIDHRLVARSSRGGAGTVPLEPQAVAVFYERAIDVLKGLGVAAAINDLPSEFPSPIRFSEDRTHFTYAADAAHRFWRVLVQADRVFKHFRTGFLGKVSPVHFFWGGFDLAVTRFSGRLAPLHPSMPGLPDAVTRDAYSHEVSSAGFWPGNAIFPVAVFYSYAYPEPPGYRARPIAHGAYFHEEWGEFFLPYETVRRADDPDAMLLDFLTSTYVAAADCGGWDRAALECPLGRPGRPRAIESADKAMPRPG